MNDAQDERLLAPSTNHTADREDRLATILDVVGEYRAQVFPCARNDKSPLTERGFYDATSDSTQISRWLRTFPNCNWAMRTGGETGIIVVDVDIKNGKQGDIAWNDLERVHGPWPHSTRVFTPTGGWHLWLDASGMTLQTGTDKLGRGVDLKADGGYVMIPPSVIDGVAYRFTERGHLAPVPAWMVKLATAMRNDPRGIKDENIKGGERNTRLTSIAGAMRNQGASHESILAALRDVNARQCESPLDPDEVARIAGSVSRYQPSPPRSTRTRADFLSYLPDRRYIDRPTGQLWPGESVNACMSPIVSGNSTIKPTALIDREQPVHQLTWAPGHPEIIEDVVIDQGGFVPHQGNRVYNNYRSPAHISGNSRKAGKWRDHIRRLYSEGADHYEDWVAHVVQKEGIKINHAVVMGGGPGIGKDTALEPVKCGVGPWNFAEVSPVALMGRFNSFVKARLLRVSEVRDLGEADRYTFAEHTKTLLAAPPDVLRVDEKNVREYYIPNVVNVVMTTNHPLTGLYLTPDDRRHFVLDSELRRGDLPPGYFSEMYEWYEAGGIGHVVAFLLERDLTGFDPKAPPPRTAAFEAIVHANSPPEESDLADLIEQLGSPKALTLSLLRSKASELRVFSVHEFLTERGCRRQVPHRLAACGYELIMNKERKDGRWLIGGVRETVYARRNLARAEQLAAARDLETTARESVPKERF